MGRQLALWALMCGVASSTSGCCLFCPWWDCGYYEPWGCGPQVYSAPSYGQCVVPPGCPECGTGIYGAYADPVQRARAVRLDRVRRRNMAYAPHSRNMRPPRMPRQPRGAGGMGMYGYDDYGMDGYAFDGYDDYAYDPYLDGMVGYGDGFGGGEYALMSHTSGGWMPSGGCNCGAGGGMMMSADAGGWVNSGGSDCPTCGQTFSEPMPTYSPSAAPANPGLQPVPRSQPHAESSGGAQPASAEEYYMPRPMPMPMPTSGTSIESSTGGNPVQPVLWVPQGL